MTDRKGIRWTRPMVAIGAMALLLSAVVTYVVWQTSPQTDDRPAVSPVEAKAVPQSTLDDALRLAREGLATLDTVVDYRARLIKRERVAGTLMEECEMTIKIRNPQPVAEGRLSPLSVYLHFDRPSRSKGREVIWVDGRNDGQLMAHEAGLLNVLRAKLQPDSWLAMQGNKYPITQIGLRRLVEQLIVRGQEAKKISTTEVRFVPDQMVGDVACMMIEVKHPQAFEGAPFHLAQIFIDPTRMIPLRYAAFGWPSKAGEPAPLDEEYTYLDVVLNVGLTDADFDPDNPAYNYP
jgi:hypothetical protein